jgi:RNA polymerase sigma factor (TIGR02999 family)
MPVDADNPDSDLSVDESFAWTYRELKRLARVRLRGGGRDVLLDTTALVHEAYMRLGPRLALRFPDTPRFLAYASRVMRSVIVDEVRHRASERHGGGCVRIQLTGDPDALLRQDVDNDYILRVHEAVEALQKQDARMAQVVEMRWFGGFSEAEIASAIGVTERTVRRDWEHARLLLAEALR